MVKLQLTAREKGVLARQDAINRQGKYVKDYVLRLWFEEELDTPGKSSMNTALFG